MNKSYSSTYNPDVLSTLANLSSDEVFTPPHIVNQMLDMLPQELFSDKTTTFLDPATKSGVFLREITKRLIKGLEKEIPDLQERLDHILHNQVFGIATTELTSLLSRRTLYCTKYPQSIYSISKFNRVEGNITYNDFNHSWESGRCIHCGVRESEFLKSNLKEKYAYEFIHSKSYNGFDNMKFDVIVGNPPYQLNVGNEGGNSSKARAIYHEFINQAIILNPRFVVLITPSRWMTRSVEGISEEWIDKMITSNHFIELHDFIESKDVFPGVDIPGGVNYFLYSKNHTGDCRYNLYKSGEIQFQINDKLDYLGLGIVLRDLYAASIIKKISNVVSGNYFNTLDSFQTIVSPKDFFTNKTHLTSSWSHYHNDRRTGDIKLYLNKRIHGRDFAFIDCKQVPKNHDSIRLHKVYISAAYGDQNTIIGKPFYGEPESVCSQTYLVIGYNPQKPLSYEECQNIISYINTRFFRYLVSIKKKTQNGSRMVYQLVPLLDFSRSWNDHDLFDMFSLSTDEINYINKTINLDI
jgi:adenine-specific DNA methylase